MAARFRKIGVTTVGAAAGVALATWALNPFDRSSYSVNGQMRIHSQNQWSPKITIFAGKCSGNRNATRQTTAAVTQRASEHFAKRRRIWCAHHWRWCNRCWLCPWLDHERYVQNATVNICVGSLDLVVCLQVLKRLWSKATILPAAHHPDQQNLSMVACDICRRPFSG